MKKLSVAFLTGTIVMLAACNTGRYYANMRIGHGDSPSENRELTRVEESKKELIPVQVTPLDGIIATEEETPIEEEITEFNYTPLENCDELYFRDGKMMTVKVKRTKGDYVYFSVCPDVDKGTDSIQKVKLTEIRYADGRKVIYGKTDALINENTSNELKTTTDVEQDGAETAAAVFMVLGILFLLLFPPLAILFGLASTIFSIVALVRNKNKGTSKRKQSYAGVYLVISIMVVLIGLLLVLLMALSIFNSLLAEVFFEIFG